MSNITPTTASAFIPQKWSTDIIRETEAKLVLGRLVHDYSAWIKDNGNTVEIPELSNLVANDKVSGVAVSLQSPTEIKQTLNVNTHKETSFLLEDIAAIQANVDLNAEYTGKAGFAIAQAMDSDIAALASGFSQVQGTYNTAITADVILDSVQSLDDANVPEEDRHFVMKPQVKRDIIDITTYISNDFVSGSPVVTGKLGTLYGVEAHMTTQIVKTGNNTNNMLFHRDAIGKAVQKEPTTNTDYENLEIGWSVVTDTIYGVDEVRDTFGVLVRS